jgi:RNA polymerase sigma-70 factor (sigma-E family)
MPGRDAAAFAEFARARSSALFRSAYLMVGDHGHAQDLVQEALTKTYVAWPRLRDTTKAEAYTRRAITTTAISWWRRRSWSERPSEVLPQATQAGPAEEHAVRDWVWQALLDLPPRQRAAIVLRYYEDLTEAQTAATMGCAVGTVKSQVAQGIKKLRERLGDDAELISLSELGALR